MILIQGAMDVETDCLVTQLEERETIVLGGWTFWRGQIGAQQIVVSRTGIGTVNCAAATALGIQAFAPSVVLNQGLAGAHRETIHVGDIVIGQECIHIHDLITPTKVAGEGSDPFEWALHDHSEKGVIEVYRSDPKWTQMLTKRPYTRGAVYLGRLGAGDIFSREVDRIHWLTARAGHLCEDMEGISTFQVSSRMGVPCVGLRIISNNELTGEPYRREVGIWLQEFLIGSCKQMTHSYSENGEN